jgi:hypothetical protein
MQASTIRMTGKRRPGRTRFGPPFWFAASILAALGVLAASATVWSRDLALPLASTFLFFVAGLTATAGWQEGRASDGGPVTYRDVAGALTFIGTFAAALMDPEQMVRIFDGTWRRD